MQDKKLNIQLSLCYNKTHEITALIGEYDAPELQKKDLATINLLGSGNSIIYGVSTFFQRYKK